MERKDSRIVRGLCDTYKIYRTTDALTGGDVLEVHRLYEVDKGIYDEEPLGEIDGNFNETDELILNEIDARFDKNGFSKDKVLNS
jgi:hypothetical protein